MLSRRAVLKSAVSLLAFPQVVSRAYGQVDSAGADLKKIKGDLGLTKILEEYAAGENLPAVYLAVTYRDQFFGAVTGVLRRDVDRPARLSDRFRIGSVTKPFTSTLVMYLVQSELIRLEEPIFRYLEDVAPYLNPGFRNVTVRQLLNHVSGLPGPGIGHSSRRPGESADAWAVRSRLEDSFHAMKETPPHPAGRLIYSNIGFTVLGAVIEAATKTQYEKLMRDKLFSNLYMHQSDIGMPGTKGNLTDPWYYPVKNGVDEPPFDPCPENDQGPGAAPNGGAYTTIRDACMFMQAHAKWYAGYDWAGVKQSTLWQMRRTLYSTDRDAIWFLSQHHHAGLLLMHGGQNSDFRGPWNACQMWILPEVGAGIFLATSKGTSMRGIERTGIQVLDYIL